MSTNPSSTRPAGAVEINPTLWGYVVRSDHPGMRGAPIARLMRRLAGGASIFVAAGLLFLAARAPEGAETLMRLLAAMFFVFLAVVLLHRLPGAILRELRVDLGRGRLVAGLRGSGGGFCPTATLAASEVEEVLLLPEPDSRAGQAMLALRLADEPEALIVAQGSAALLEPLHERLQRDLAQARAPRPAPRRRPRAQAAGKALAASAAA